MKSPLPQHGLEFHENNATDQPELFAGCCSALQFEEEDSEFIKVYAPPPSSTVCVCNGYVSACPLPIFSCTRLGIEINDKMPGECTRCTEVSSNDVRISFQGEPNQVVFWN